MNEGANSIPEPMESPKSEMSSGMGSTTSPKPMIIEKKCFVKIVAIGDSGVGKTSLI